MNDIVRCCNCNIIHDVVNVFFLVKSDTRMDSSFAECGLSRICSRVEFRGKDLDEISA